MNHVVLSGSDSMTSDWLSTLLHFLCQGGPIIAHSEENTEQEENTKKSSLEVAPCKKGSGTGIRGWVVEMARQQ